MNTRIAIVEVGKNRYVRAPAPTKGLPTRSITTTARDMVYDVYRVEAINDAIDIALDRAETAAKHGAAGSVDSVCAAEQIRAARRQIEFLRALDR
mgnify:CR=1 FL=1